MIRIRSNETSPPLYAKKKIQGSDAWGTDGHIWRTPSHLYKFLTVLGKQEAYKRFSKCVIIQYFDDEPPVSTPAILLLRAIFEVQQ